MPVTRHLYLLTTCLLLLAGPLLAQAVDLEGRPIAAVRIRGLEEVPRQLVRNQVRLQAGDPYRRSVVQGDISRITHLGRFSNVDATATQREDGSVVLTYTVNEQPLLQDVQVVGNKALADEELLEQVVLRAGDPRDPFLIERGKEQILDAYTKEGYFVADVTVDQQALNEQQVLIYRVREGPRVSIQAIRFEGNTVYSEGTLDGQIKSDAYFPLLADGILSREQLQLDAASIRDFYRNRGYLDAQVGRQIDLSPNQQNAVVTFMIDEGPQYTVGAIDVEHEGLFPKEQIRMQMPLTRGDYFSSRKQEDSVQALRNLYGELGYIEAQVNIERIFHENEPVIDLLVQIQPGRSYRVGQVTVRGNSVTKQSVILRELRGMNPGQRYDREGIQETRENLRQSRLFSSSNVTILGDEAEPVRDALIEVDEAQTGRLSLGAGVSSDAGAIGAITLTQRNFDIADVPESFGQFITGNAFRGGGQSFRLSLQPGTELSRYSFNWSEPYLLETNYSFNVGGRFFNRQRDQYLEKRLGGDFGFGRRFGDVWSGSLSFRGENVELSNIATDAPLDVFAVRGESQVTAAGFSMERNTTDNPIFPTEGSRLQFGVERVGALGGDFDFTKLTAEFRKFWTVDEDFLGRRTVFSFRGEVGFIPEENEAPVFERFYAGGHGTFRGFDFRGVGPRGIRADTGERSEEAVGGRFQLLTGLEYQFPLVDDWLRGVVFTDQGIVSSEPRLDKWRVSVGTGVRLQVPFFGRAPFALDFAFPIVEESGDERRIFSFNLDVPLQ